jgi:hypothetical protein
MKKLTLMFALLVTTVTGIIAFRSAETGSIKGIVVPADGATHAWAYSAKDTVSAGITQGVFILPGLRPGTYEVLIQAVAPYKNALRSNVVVKEGEATDVGQLILEQNIPMSE